MNKSTLPRFLQPFYCSDLVRLGKANDGGYLVNKLDIARTEHLVSLGIGTDYSFEQEFAKLTQCQVHGYDGSITCNDDFFRGSNSFESRNITTAAELDAILYTNTFLKCDIEGAEYALLDSIIKNSSRLTGIVIELHNLTSNINAVNIANFLCKLQQRLVHVHVNNYFYYKTPQGPIPDILELSFTGSSNIDYRTELTLPHSLDQPNNPNDSEFEIVFV